jgi:hypothetical protein
MRFLAEHLTKCKMMLRSIHSTYVLCSVCKLVPSDFPGNSRMVRMSNWYPNQTYLSSKGMTITLRQIMLFGSRQHHQLLLHIRYRTPMKLRRTQLILRHNFRHQPRKLLCFTPLRGFAVNPDSVLRTARSREGTALLILPDKRINLLLYTCRLQ